MCSFQMMRGEGGRFTDPLQICFITAAFEVSNSAGAAK